MSPSLVVLCGAVSCERSACRPRCRRDFIAARLRFSARAVAAPDRPWMSRRTTTARWSAGRAEMESTIRSISRRARAVSSAEASTRAVETGLRSVIRDLRMRRTCAWEPQTSVVMARESPCWAAWMVRSLGHDPVARLWLRRSVTRASSLDGEEAGAGDDRSCDGVGDDRHQGSFVGRTLRRADKRTVVAKRILRVGRGSSGGRFGCLGRLRTAVEPANEATVYL